jgi:hypothetical protein
VLVLGALWIPVLNVFTGTRASRPAAYGRRKHRELKSRTSERAGRPGPGEDVDAGGNSQLFKMQ